MWKVHCTAASWLHISPPEVGRLIDLCSPSIATNSVTTLFVHLHLQEIHVSLYVFCCPSSLTFSFPSISLSASHPPSSFLLLLSISPPSLSLSCFAVFLPTFATHSHSLSNRTSFLSILAYCVFSFAVIGFDEIYSVWAATPPYLGKHQQLQDRYMW